MWIKDENGDLVNTNQITYITMRPLSNNVFAIVAYGQMTNHEDYAHTYYLMIDTEAQCRMAMEALPMPVAWSAKDYK